MVKSAGKITQDEHLDAAKASKIVDGILVPGEVVDLTANDISTAGRLVKTGSLLRIQVAADTYVAFGDSTIAAVDATTSPAIKLPAGYHLLVSTADFIRASANASRLEILEQEEN